MILTIELRRTMRITAETPVYIQPRFEQQLGCIRSTKISSFIYFISLFHVIYLSFVNLIIFLCLLHYHCFTLFCYLLNIIFIFLLILFISLLCFFRYFIWFFVFFIILLQFSPLLHFTFLLDYIPRPCYFYLHFILFFYIQAGNLWAKLSAKQNCF